MSVHRGIKSVIILEYPWKDQLNYNHHLRNRASCILGIFLERRCYYEECLMNRLYGHFDTIAQEIRTPIRYSLHTASTQRPQPPPPSWFQAHRSLYIMSIRYRFAIVKGRQRKSKIQGTGRSPPAQQRGMNRSPLATDPRREAGGPGPRSRRGAAGGRSGRYRRRKSHRLRRGRSARRRTGRGRAWPVRGR